MIFVFSALCSLHCFYIVGWIGTAIQLSSVFGRPFVKGFALCYRSVVLSVCLSVTLVYCGQTVGRIKTKFGVQVGLGPGHTVLDGDPSPPPLKGHSPPIFGPYLLRPNGCMDQDVTWYGARPQLRRICDRWRPCSTLPRKGAEPHSPIFGPCLLLPNGWMDQDGTWHEGGPRSRRHCA